MSLLLALTYDTTITPLYITPAGNFSNVKLGNITNEVSKGISGISFACTTATNPFYTNIELVGKSFASTSVNINTDISAIFPANIPKITSTLSGINTLIEISGLSAPQIVATRPNITTDVTPPTLVSGIITSAVNKIQSIDITLPALNISAVGTTNISYSNEILLQQATSITPKLGTITSVVTINGDITLGLTGIHINMPIVDINRDISIELLGNSSNSSIVSGIYVYTDILHEIISNIPIVSTIKNVGLDISVTLPINTSTLLIGTNSISTSINGIAISSNRGNISGSVSFEPNLLPISSALGSATNSGNAYT